MYSSSRPVLSSCSVSLHQGRYSWRHNAVLSVLKRHLLKFLDHIGNEARSSDAPFIRLVLEHAASFRPHSSDRSRRPLFSSDALRCASDWVFLFDLEDALIFPPGADSICPERARSGQIESAPVGALLQRFWVRQNRQNRQIERPTRPLHLIWFCFWGQIECAPEIADTLQRPDIVIFSRALRQVILIELTVPLEDRVCAAHERKETAICHYCLCARVTDGMQLISRRSRMSRFCCLFAHQMSSAARLSTVLGKKVRNEASKVSLRCSYLIYLRRNIRVWQERLGD